MAFLPAALAAAPVAAKEAARKMGLEGAIGSMGIGGGGLAPSGCSPIPDGGSWVKRMIARFYSPQAKRERFYQAEWDARRLDSDLASMRSISPAVAYRIQLARSEKRIEGRNYVSLQEQLQEEVKAGVGL